MKFMHTGDLHIGKRICEFSMLENQRDILKQILDIAIDEKIDGILITGDIYDKSTPSTDAVEMFDEFLSNIEEADIKCFAISGNHDSAGRIAFGSRIMSKSGVHLSKVYSGELEKIMLKDKFGDIAVWLLPFLKPCDVRPYFSDIEIGSYESAIQNVIKHSCIDTSIRNILLAHQFVTANGKEPERSESETISLGGIDNVDYSIFKDFEYVALGHIHGPQKIGRDTVRYCGSPLTYSFSEVKQKKSVTIISFKEKGEVDFKQIRLKPIRDFQEIKGAFKELISPKFFSKINLDNYFHITLTDESIMDAKRKLETIYKNIMRLDFDNTFTRNATKIKINLDSTYKKPLEYFEEFYENQNGSKLDKKQKKYVEKIFQDISEGGVQ